jgi:hypothetical protein
MKRALFVVILAGLTGAGCMTMREEHKPPKAVMKDAPPPVVTEHGINEKNAAEKAEALRRELEHDLAKKGAAGGPK